MSNDTATPAAPSTEAEDSTITPNKREIAEEDDLPTLLAEATAAYSQKHYREAAELYSRATELQAEQNGEMSTKNAELLYLYGRCLFHVAVENSDVLGEKVAGEKPKEKSSKKVANGQDVHEEQDKRIAEEGVAAIANGDINDSNGVEESKPSATKPFFQFTGDENFDDSGEEDGADEGEGEGQEAEAEEDELMNAFEILDLTRVLLQRQLEELQKDDANETSIDQDAIIRVQERLADTHDLQAEISLEGEQFPAAVSDFRKALAIKQELYPPESSYLAELHFKLSLALEFASVTQPKDTNGEVDPNQVSTVDEAMREEAAKEMEAAISSCKQRIVKEEAALAAGSEVLLPGRKEKVTQKSINDVKEMVADMEQRVNPNPPTSSMTKLTKRATANRPPPTTRLHQRSTRNRSIGWRNTTQRHPRSYSR